MINEGAGAAFRTGVGFDYGMALQAWRDFWAWDIGGKTTAEKVTGFAW